ncbi:MAG: hypothetical protein US20_C0026G0022 [Candidatus Pacebacteria bacterium GW2011_GWF1_36_5]|nr:MAG: hypothetical protein US20_C0026G0022 [Candidatus Pacebacteria bacterium GW2011_GWF1_36_5]
MTSKSFPYDIIPLEEGWKESSIYLVEVCFSSNNPIHAALFYSGFLRNGKPGNYNQLWNPSWDRTFNINQIYYLRVIKNLGNVFEDIPNLNKLLKETK